MNNYLHSIRVRITERARDLLDFWSRGDAYWASGINRILIYYAAWMTLEYHSALLGFSFSSPSGVSAWLAMQSPDLWQPHGLARFLFHPPTAQIVWLLIWVAWLSTGSAIIGFLGRISTVISALSISAIVALSLSWQPYWSHGFNILCIVPLAFMWNGSPSVSVDELLRKYITKRPEPLYPLWPSLLGQAAIALFLFAAFYAKLGFLRGEHTLNWIISDNMRNSVVMPYAMRGYDMTWWIKLLVSSPIFYVTAAAAHMVMQGFPILSIFTRDPRWRLVEGAMFFLGTALLYFVMTLGVAPWFLLCGLFVDWDYWIAKLRRISTPTGSTRAIKIWPSFAALYSISFVVLFIAVSSTKAAWTNGFYPFSPMDFYSTVADRVSLHERLHARAFVHRGYIYWLGNDVTYHKSGYVNDYQGIFDSACSYLAPHADDKIKIGLTKYRYAQIMANSGRFVPLKKLVSPWAPWRYYPKSAQRYVEKATTRYEMGCSIKAIPPYPENPLAGKLIHTALMSVYDVPTKTVLMATGKVDLIKDVVTFKTYGFKDPHLSLFYADNPEKADGYDAPKPIPGHWKSRNVFVPVKKDVGTWFTIIRVREGSSGRSYDFWGPYLYYYHNVGRVVAK